MDRIDIEKHIADYLSGEISPGDEQQLINEFNKNPTLKEEVEELRFVWGMLEKVGSGVQMQPDGDQKFYDMLNDEKFATNTSPPYFRRLSGHLLKLAAAILLFIAAFGLGRYTMGTKTIVIYKTAVIKKENHRPVPPAVMEEKRQAKVAKSRKTPVSVPLFHSVQPGLNSVFASERLNAVLAMAPQAGRDEVTLTRLIRVLKNDENPNVRLAALEALRPLSGRRSVQFLLISAMSGQDDEMVKRSIIELLFEAKSGEAIPQMVAMLNNDNIDPLTKQQLKVGIENFLN